MRRQVPKVYIEVISNDNYSTPYIIENDSREDPSVFLLQSGPTKKLNYEINERLLAPFKKRHQSPRPNWYTKPISGKEISQVSGLNRYSGGKIKPDILLKASLYPVQVRKKIVRKKVNRPSPLAASSSVNQYGHPSTRLLTGSLVTQPMLLNKIKHLIKQHSISSSPSPKLFDKVSEDGWKPVDLTTIYSTSTTTSTTSPLNLNEKDIRTESKQSMPTPVMTVKSSSTKPYIPTQRNKPQTELKNINSDKTNSAAEAKPQLSNSLSNQVDVKTDKPENVPSIPLFVPKVPYITPRPIQFSKAQYNRYIVISKENKTEPSDLKFATTQAKSLNGARFPFDSQRVSHYQVSPLERSTLTPTTDAPLRVTLEDYIKKAIEQSQTPKGTSSMFKQSISTTHKPATPGSILIGNHLDKTSLTLSEEEPASRLTKQIKPISWFRRNRKYRPLISLNQSVTEPTVAPPPPPKFVSHRIPPLSGLNNKESIRLEDHNSIMYYSPKNNDVFEDKANDTTVSWNYFTSSPPVVKPKVELTTATPPSTILGNSYATYGPSDESFDMDSNLQTTQFGSVTTKSPSVLMDRDRYPTRLWKSTYVTPIPTTSTTTTSVITTPTITTEAPKTTPTNSLLDYDNYDDYDYADYKDYKDSNERQITTTSTTTTTTAAPVVVSYRRLTNVTRFVRINNYRSNDNNSFIMCAVSHWCI